MTTGRPPGRHDPGAGAAGGDSPPAAPGPQQGAASAPPDDPEQLRQEIDRTRERLGSVVEELATRADVKQRAQEKAGQLSRRVEGKAAESAEHAKAAVGGAYRGLVSKTAAARHTAASAASVPFADRAAAAGPALLERTPPPVQRTMRSAAAAASRNRAALAVAGTAIAACAALAAGYVAVRMRGNSRRPSGDMARRRR